MVAISGENIVFLSEKDVISAGGVNMERCIEMMESVFELYNQNRVIMGESGQYLHGHMTTFPSNLSEEQASTVESGSRFGAMPAYVGGDINKVGVKWYGSVPSSGVSSPPLLTLNDPTDGRPVAMLNGSVISSMRTGAMVGLGASTLQHHDAETAVIIGPGRAGQASALGLDTAIDSIETTYVFHPERDKAAAFANVMRNRVSFEVVPETSLKNAVERSEIVVSTATPNPAPAIDPDWLRDDSTVVQIGDLSVPLDGFDDDQIFCDISSHPFEFEAQVGWDITGEFTRHYDERGNEKSDIRTLHELLGGEDSGTTRGKSFLSSLGLPMEDVAWGSDVLTTALDENLGTALDLSSQAYFSRPY
jgi:ornithine cyclodeaminase